MFEIYLITNRVNGKVYVGKTSRTAAVRFREHLNEANVLPNRHLCKAIRAHGPDNFFFEVMRVTEEEAEANWLESLYIGITKSYRHEFGYNDTFGGDGVVGTPETREKIRLAKLGKTPTTEDWRDKLKAARQGKTPALGMKHTDEWKAQHSARMSGSGHPRFGKQLSEETKRKISESHKGKVAWNKGKKLNDDGKFQTEPIQIL